MKNSHSTLRASIKSETTIDLCMKKWGSNNIDWPHTRESGGSVDPPDPLLPRSMDHTFWPITGHYAETRCVVIPVIKPKRWKKWHQSSAYRQNNVNSRDLDRMNAITSIRPTRRPAAWRRRSCIQEPPIPLHRIICATFRSSFVTVDAKSLSVSSVNSRLFSPCRTIAKTSSDTWECRADVLTALYSATNNGWTIQFF